MFMDDQAEVEIAGTLVADFALKGTMNGPGVAELFKAFLHLVAGF